jgi:cystathionine beta-synthase
MFNTHNSILDTIGKTPLIRLNHIGANLPPTIYVKLEMDNPGRSVKDRIAVAMIDEAERLGKIKPGDTIVEATSGNTGVALAMVAAVRGYRCVFVTHDRISTEKLQILKAYGAEVVITPVTAPASSPEGYEGVARRLAREIPNAHQPDQFHNLTNPQCHYMTTGPEIWEQTEGKVTCFVGGAGTGGTVTGVARFLKEKNPRVRIVGADPEGSGLSGGEPKIWAVEGIGEADAPDTFDPELIDTWHRVSDRESFAMARALARQEGLLVGGSCGTAVAAALKVAPELNADDIIVALCPDTGRNYLSKIYSDDWMTTNGYLSPPAGSRPARKAIAV